MNEGSQTNLATCDLFPVAMTSFTPAMRYYSIVGATFEHLKFCTNSFQNKSFLSSSA